MGILPSATSDLVPVQPPLKWAGGKRWQLPLLRPLWSGESNRRLVEPFCGALAVALGLQPSRALLNDINPHLGNFYRWLQSGLRVRRQFQNDSDYYYRQRRRFNRLLTSEKANSKEAAILFYYLNRTGYNGLCRFNSSGEFNVPFGRHKKINYRTNFTSYRAVLEKWEFGCSDFESLNLDGSDFIYADPPYDVPFTQYSKGGFDWDQQVRTAEWLARHPGPVVLSNQATPRILELYNRLGYKVKEVAGPRRISCTGDRKPATEVIATRNLEEQRKVRFL